MAYHIYTTRGLVLSQTPVREADRIYSILTRDLGLLRAVAGGVRKESSKLRGSLEPLAISNISLVRGKGHWRLTSAESIKKISAEPGLARPLALLDRLVQGEVPHPELFDAVEESVLSPDPRDEAFEIGLVSKILFHLGYLSESDLNLDKKSLIKAINVGIEASGLA